MPTVTLNRKVFENLIGKKLTEEKLKERISMLGTDLEGVYENEIVVEVFPNRPDLLSEQGFARAFSSFIGAKKGLRNYKVKKSGEKVIVDGSVSDVRPYTACAIVKNLKFDDEKIREVIQIQEKLHITYGRNRKKCAIGIYPLEKIKFPITYAAKDPKQIKFIPLDSNKPMNGLEILQKHKTGREYAHLLDGKSKFPIFIDANNNILSMPPIINSETVGKITDKASSVFIECSGFDFNTLSICLNIIITALADMGGIVYSLTLDYGKTKKTTPDLKPGQMSLDIRYINRILGLNLKESDVKKYLEQMGYGYKNKKAIIPAYRADILHQIDLTEDIAIAYGYENFKEEIPKVATIAEENKFESFCNKISDFLVGLSIMETNTYHLMSEKELNEKMSINQPLVKLLNGSEEYNSVRSWLIPSLLKVLSINQHRDFPQNIFEIGTCCIPDENSETQSKEFRRLAVLLSSADSDYTKIRQILDALMKALDLSCEIREADHNSFIPGRTARISVKNKDIAYIGEIHPKVLENWGLQMPVAAFELNMTDLYGIKKETG